MVKVTVSFTLDMSAKSKEALDEEIKYVLGCALEEDELEYTVEDMDEEEEDW